MIFVMQTAYDQKNNHAVSLVHDMVYVAKEEAKIEGGFTPEIQERLRRNLSRALGAPLNEIHVTCREEGGLLFYRVEAPIRNVMAGSGLFGIRDADNRYIYVIDSYTRARAIADTPPSVDADENDGGEEPISTY